MRDAPNNVEPLFCRFASMVSTEGTLRVLRLEWEPQTRELVKLLRLGREPLPWELVKLLRLGRELPPWELLEILRHGVSIPFPDKKQTTIPVRGTPMSKR